MQKKILIWLAIFVAIGCFVTFVIIPNEEATKKRGTVCTITNVARIFMHEPGDYSFMIQKPEGAGKAKRYRMSQMRFGQEPTIIADVKAGELMWIKYQAKSFKESAPGSSYHILEFHVHSPEDISGGGWDHGKFGKGNTIVVQ